MPSGHSKDDYTYERMKERRNRNNIRRILERNGRRLTAREIDIVNLCTTHPDQRYTLFSYLCDTNCMRLNPYVLPFLTVPNHHQSNGPQQQASVSSNSDRSMSTSVVAPLLFQTNVDGDAQDSSTDEVPQSQRPSTSRVHLPCYLLSDGTEAPESSNIAFNSAVNLIADTIIESLKSGSEKGNSEKESSDKGNEEKGSSGKDKSKKISRKNCKKKKKCKKHGEARAGPSETQSRSNNNLSDEPSISISDSSNYCSEISRVDGDGYAQRVKRDNEVELRCFSSNSSDQCHVDVSGSNSILSGNEGNIMEVALSKTVRPAEVVVNEDLSSVKETTKVEQIQCSSDACISNDFIPVVSGRRGKYRRSSQQGSNHSDFAAISMHGGDQLSTWHDKPLKFVSTNKPALHIKCSEPTYMRNKTTMAHEFSEKNETSTEFDMKQDAKPDPSKLPTHSGEDNESSERIICRHSGEYVYKKDYFPSLPPPNNCLEVVSHKVGLTRQNDLKKLVVSLPKKVSEECKEYESETTTDIKLSVPNLEVNGEIEETSTRSESTFEAFFSIHTSKSCQKDQSSHDTSGLDSPRSSKASDEPSLKHDVCSSGSKEGNNKSHIVHGISALDEKCSSNVVQYESFPSAVSNNFSADIEASRSSSSICNSPAVTTPISPIFTMPHHNIGELKDMSDECNPNLRDVLGAVRAAHTVYLMSELVQTTFGGPLADYELLCHYAAPIIDVPPHQIANVPLQKIWQWYEEPSYYALEVKGCHDHNNCMGFTAHFVPSMSALQLFVRCDVSAIFSKNLSKHGGLESALGEEDGLSLGAEPAKLVYEYFEAEQPYLRQPMFEKLKQLVGGLAKDKSQSNGDAHHLEHIRLGNLHPASWYCVAWYPAYRVPNGRSRFKAAFLTYHSLGHFVQGQTSPLVATSPVVGLMYYNTEESWFNERYRAQDVIRVRLESLNTTASAMARACVTRGREMFRNHHPDFEFFASRRPNIEF